MFIELLVSVCVLVTATFVGSLLLTADTSTSGRRRRGVLVWAVMLGGSMLLMHLPIHLPGGGTIDLSLVPLALTGLCGGAGLSLVASGVLVAYKYITSGGPLLSEVLSILLIGLGGLLLGRKGSHAQRSTRFLLQRGLPLFALAELTWLLTDSGAATLLHRGTFQLVINLSGLVMAGAIVKVRLQSLQHVAELRQMAHTDPLTGLPNRRFLERCLKQMPMDTPSSLLLIDLDHFKQINDRHGHLIGDRVLKDIADILTEQTRLRDVACRYGGEEFAVLLPGCQLHQAEMIAGRLRDAVANYRLPVHDGSSIRVTFSGGLVPLLPSEDLRSQLAAADELLYQAKSGGRDRILVA